MYEIKQNARLIDDQALTTWTCSFDDGRLSAEAGTSGMLTDKTVTLLNFQRTGITVEPRNDDEVSLIFHGVTDLCDVIKALRFMTKALEDQIKEDLVEEEA